MIPRYLAETWAAVAPAVANHLWQSTIFAAGAALLTLALRKNRAQVRYGLWLAASLKFLVPFSLLVGVGSYLAGPGAPAEVQSGLYVALQEASQPFARPTGAPALPSVAATAAPANPTHFLPLLLVIVWLCGFVTVLCTWCLRWRRMSRACRAATPLLEGREVGALRRVERLGRVRKPITMLLCRTSLEPGIFGIVRPVLLWPAGISEQLEDAHLEAILAHELWHVRRRDNFAALAHMAVEAIFWFHPLVWWLGARLVDERERACDEAVLQLGHQAQAYAESILKACEFCVGTRLACAAGVTGSDLKDRVLRIMAGSSALKLDLRKKLLLALAALVAVAVPIAFGLANGQQGAASSATADATGPTPGFEVASIKPDKTQMGRRVMFRIVDPANDGRFYADGPTLRMLLKVAFGVQDSQIVGGPSWMDTERFDIQAKADDSVSDQLKKLSEDQGLALKHRMLQALLTDRFKLTIRHETRELPVYALVLAKNGPKMEESKDEASSSPQAGAGQGVIPGQPRALGGGRRMISFHPGGSGQEANFEDSTMASFAEFIADQLGSKVVDRTGLKGSYNFTLKWTPDESQRRILGPGPGPGPGAGPGQISATAAGSRGGNVAIGGGNGPGVADAPPQSSDTSGPSLFTAIQEQLGLKIESQKGPVDVLVIDHAEQPSED